MVQTQTLTAVLFFVRITYEKRFDNTIIINYNGYSQRRGKIMKKKEIKKVLNELMKDNDKMTITINKQYTIKLPLDSTDKEIYKNLKKVLTNLPT